MSIQYSRLIEWANQNTIVYSFLAKYQPNTNVHQDITLLQHFPKFTIAESEHIFYLIRQSYSDKFFFQKLLHLEKKNL